MNKYMHTIDGMPAQFDRCGDQISFAGAGPIRLEPDLKTIRKQQKASREWRAKQGWQSPKYSHKLVKVS